jgi:hypothetical protein
MRDGRMGEISQRQHRAWFGSIPPKSDGVVLGLVMLKILDGWSCAEREETL